MKLDDILRPGTRPEILGTGYGFTEGPAADAGGNVYFSDGRNDSIYFHEAGGGVVQFADDSTDANGMMLNAEGELYACEGAAHRVVAIDVATKKKKILCDEFEGRRFNEPNDLAIDSSGGFYFSDPNYQHRGQPTVRKEDVYYCSAAGQISRVSTVCFKPNGVLLSPDDKFLFVADSHGQRLYRYEVRGPGLLDDETLWIDRLGANPDGLTLDEFGNLYICCGKAGIKVYARGREPLGTIAVSYASNCCFGGSDFTTLMVTSQDKLLGISTAVPGMRPLPGRVRRK